jgi:hypothetical protein
LAVVQCGVTPEGALDEVIKLPARIVTACTFGGPHLDQLSALLRRRITAGGQAELMRRRPAQVPTPRSGFAGFRFPSEVIMVAVRWYLRYGLSYRDVEELLAERGIAVDHVTIYRRVQRFTPLLIEAARPCRMPRVIGGLSTRPTSRSLAGGSTCTGRSTSSGGTVALRRRASSPRTKVGSQPPPAP